MSADVQLEACQCLSLKVAAWAAELVVCGLYDFMHPCTVIDKTDAVPLCCSRCMVDCRAPRRKCAEAPWTLVCDHQGGNKRHDAMLLSPMCSQGRLCMKPFTAQAAIPLCVDTLPVTPEWPEYYFHLLHAFRARFYQWL